MYHYDRSYALLDHARTLIPGGVQSSRRPFVSGAAPVYLERAQGCHAWDVDGNEYVDYTLSLGPIILGYADTVVDDAVVTQIRRGTVYTLNHPIQNHLAEILAETIPSAEMSLFFKTGSDGTTAAVRIARTATSRDLILRCGYHGWHDWCYLGTGVPAAVREQTIAFEYNDLPGLHSLLDENYRKVAAIIVQPGGETMQGVVHEPQPGYLQGIRDLANANGCVLIFDEVRSGFRMALGGAQEYFRVTPDLTTLSKAMANGYPIAAVVGRVAVMQEATATHLSATFNGEAFSMAAAVTTIQELRRRNALEQIWGTGQRLIDGINQSARSRAVRARAIGYPPMPHLRFDYPSSEENDAARTAFYTSAIGKGILLHPTHHWFTCLAHAEADLVRTLEACDQALSEVATAMSQRHVSAGG